MSYLSSTYFDDNDAVWGEEEATDMCNDYTIYCKLCVDCCLIYLFDWNIF